MISIKLRVPPLKANQYGRGIVPLSIALRKEWVVGYTS